jgi:hypothetical protein
MDSVSPNHKKLKKKKLDDSQLTKKTTHHAEYNGLICFIFGKIERISDSVKFSDFMESYCHVY